MDYKHQQQMSYADREHQATQYIIEDMAARVEKEKERQAKATLKELRHKYFAAKDELRQIMLDEYERHGEQTQVPEMWDALHKLWENMNDFCKKL